MLQFFYAKQFDWARNSWKFWIRFSSKHLVMWAAHNNDKFFCKSFTFQISFLYFVQECVAALLRLRFDKYYCQNLQILSKNYNFVFFFLLGNWCTLDSGINVGVRLLILGLFSSGYVLIKGGTFINFLIFYLLNIFSNFFSLTYV